MWLWIILAVIAVLARSRSVARSTTDSSRLRNRVENAWAQVDVQLKRRYDLIPNLVETVKGYAAHERETFESRHAGADARAQQAQGAERSRAQAEGVLSQALGRLFAVAEAYPELQADENFRQLQAELARDRRTGSPSHAKVDNDTVLTFNNAIQTFPGVLLAGTFGFTQREFFEVEDDAQREVPRVDFSRPPAVGDAGTAGGAPSEPPST